MTMLEARRGLSTVWFLGGGLLFAMLALQTGAGRFGSLADEMWHWFLPQIVPSLTLIVGVLIAGMGGSGAPAAADTYVYRLAVALSLVYLGAIGFCLVAPAFQHDPAPVRFAKGASVWLIPLQGLTTASLGAFFAKSKKGAA